jgi:hypothetical protein
MVVRLYHIIDIIFIKLIPRHGPWMYHNIVDNLKEIPIREFIKGKYFKCQSKIEKQFIVIGQLQLEKSVLVYLGI